MKKTTKKSHRGFIALAILGGIIGLFWSLSHPRISHQHTIDFAVQHQELLNEYVALSRSHSPEAETVKDQILQFHYFTDVDCWFDRNGAIQVHLSVPDGGRKRDEEGYYYQVHYCLVWQDTDYCGASPLLSFWHSLEEDGIIPNTQDGCWYYTSHKHWLYG